MYLSCPCHCHGDLYDTVIAIIGDNEEAHETAVSETATAHPSSGLCVCVCMHACV